MLVDVPSVLTGAAETAATGFGWTTTTDVVVSVGRAELVGAVGLSGGSDTVGSVSIGHSDGGVGSVSIGHSDGGATVAEAALGLVLE